MPVRYVCKRCGHILWNFERVGQDYFGVPAPEDIIRIYGVCPRCKCDLTIPSIDDITIKLRAEALADQATVTANLGINFATSRADGVALGES